MRPPAEQLIRDYLNRLSVVARNRLKPEDRRAFLARIGDFIERQSGVRGTADPAEVMRILSSIGEPETVVERERARLEARRSERAAAASRVVLWKPQGKGEADSAEADSSQLTNKDGRPLTGEIKVTSRPITARWRPGEPLKQLESQVKPPTRGGRRGWASWARWSDWARWIPRPRPGGSAPSAGGPPMSGPQTAERSAAPAGTGPAPEGSRGGASDGWKGAGGSSGAGPSGGAGSAVEARTAGGARPSAGAAPPGPGEAVSSGSRGVGHAGSNGVASAHQLPPTAPATPDAPARPVSPQAAQPDAGPLAPRPGDGAQAAPGFVGRTLRVGTARRAVRIGRVARPAPAMRGRRPMPGEVTRIIARRAADAGRQHVLETACVLLMIVAGLIYPWPLWLVGFLIWLVAVSIATMCSVWSLPDKWVGIVGPVALVIIGTATLVSMGGTLANLHDYVHEALADSVWLIKVGAVLGGGFLGWRLERGRRPPAVPPWLRRNRR